MAASQIVQSSHANPIIQVVREEMEFFAQNSDVNSMVQMNKKHDFNVEMLKLTEMNHHFNGKIINF